MTASNHLIFEGPLQGEGETQRAAAALAPYLEAGDLLALQGDLGAGKTSFARALIRALPLAGEILAEEEVPSPTFTLVQSYSRDLGPQKEGEVWHFDLYRLKDRQEIYELGWEEALGQALILLEWPERLGSLLPSSALHIELRHINAGREMTITGDATWQHRLEGFSL